MSSSCWDSSTLHGAEDEDGMAKKTRLPHEEGDVGPDEIAKLPRLIEIPAVLNVQLYPVSVYVCVCMSIT